MTVDKGLSTMDKLTTMGGRFEKTPGKGKGHRGQTNITSQTPAESATQGHLPTGGKTPIGNDKGPVKKTNDNVRDKNKREVTKKYGSLETYDRPNFIGKAIDTVKGVFGLQDNDMQIGRGIETADLFAKPKDPSKEETSCNEAKNNKKEKFVTSEKKR